MNKLDILKQRLRPSANHVGVEAFEGFKKVVERASERAPRIVESIPVSIKLDTETVSGELLFCVDDIICNERLDSEHAFLEFSPFKLKIKR